MQNYFFNCIFAKISNANPFIMQKLLSFISIIALTIFIASGADNEFRLSGRVKDAVTKMDLTQSKIILYDSIGNPRDSIQANKGFAYRNGEIDTMAVF